MADPNFRVSSDDHFIHPDKLRRNVTPIHQEIGKVLLSPMGVLALCFVSAVVGVIFPLLLIPFFLLPFFVLVATLMIPAVRHPTLPLRLPIEESPRRDYNAPNPQHRGFRKAEGTFLLGNTWGQRKEIWAAFGDLLTHCLVLGGTGAGKSEQLLSMVYNGLALGGGSVYVDPKGGPKLYGQHWTMLRLLGRDDDMRVLNLALGPDDLEKTPIIRSNTLQPFAFGKASSLKEIPLSLMAGSGDSGANSVFAANGKTLITALTMGMVDLRDMGEINFSINDMRHYIQPDNFIELAKRKDISKEAQEAMLSFLTSMGWKANEKDPAKWGDFSRQYSYAQNYFLDVLSTLSDTYRHIFNVPIGDIHMPDIIFQRRCFVAIIPALEKSKAELSTLGKITLMILRLGVASGLGDGNVMGNWRKLVDLSLSAARVPSFFFIDEYAAIAVEGFAEVFTQGRGLGISATVGSQDWAGIKKANEAEAQQIVANTKFKFIMTTDDPNDTKQLIESLSGDAMEMQAQSFAVQSMINYYDTQSATAQRTKRTDQQDFAKQVEGEWHLFYKDKIIRGFGFFAGGVPEDKETPSFVHHLLMVENPSKNSLSLRFGDLKNTLDSWKQKIQEHTENKTQNLYDSKDWEKKYKGYMPPAKVFSWALQHPQEAGNWNKKQRRELACAAVYAWMKVDPFEVSRIMLKKAKQQEEPEQQPVAEGKSPTPVSVPESPVPESPSSVSKPSSTIEQTMVPASVVTSEHGYPEKSELPALQTANDLLSSFDFSANEEKETVTQEQTESSPPALPEDKKETSSPEWQTDRGETDDSPIQKSIVPDESGADQPEAEDFPPSDTDFSAVTKTTQKPTPSVPLFKEAEEEMIGISVLSEALFGGKLEEQIESQAKTLQNSARALGASEEEAQSIPEKMVKEIKASIKKPTYPVPPKPERKSPDDIRPIAEGWVRRIKNG